MAGKSDILFKIRADDSDLKRSLKSAGNQLNAFSKKAVRAADAASMAAFAAGTLLLTKALKDTVIVGAQFEQKMASVKGISRATADEFRAMESVARELGATTEWSASQAADGLEFLSMAGFTAAQSIEALPGVLDLATAGQIELGQAADIASNALTAMRLPVSELSRVNDVFVATITSANTNMEMMAESFKYAAPVAAGFGVEIEEVAAYIGQLGNAGIQGSMAGTALAKSFLNMNKVFKEYGVSAKNADGSTKKLVDVIELLQKEGADAQKVMELFGDRAGKAVLALMGQGSEGLREYIGELENAKGRTKELADIMRDTLAGAFKELQSAIQEKYLQAFDEMGDEFEAAIDQMSEAVRNFDVKPVAEAVTSLVEGIAELADKLPELATGAKAAYESLPEWIWKVGIVGAIIGGTSGRVALGGIAAFSAFVDKWQSFHSSEAWREMRGLKKDMYTPRSGPVSLLAPLENEKELLENWNREAGITGEKLKELDKIIGAVFTEIDVANVKDAITKTGELGDKVEEVGEKAKKSIPHIEAAATKVEVLGSAYGEAVDAMDDGKFWDWKDKKQAFADLADAGQAAYDEIVDAADEGLKASEILWEDFVSETGDIIHGFVNDVVKGEFDSIQDMFGGLLDSMLDMLLNFISRAAANSLIDALFGAGASGSSLNIGSLFGGVGGAAAAGGGGGLLGGLFGGSAAVAGSGTAGAWMGGGAGAAATGVTLSGSAGATTMGGAAGADLLGVGGAGLGGMAAAGAFAAPIVLGFIDAMMREKPRLEDALTTNMLQPFELAAEGMSDEFGPLTKSLGEATIQFNSLDAASIDASAGVLAMGKNVLFAAGTTDEFSGTMLESIQVYDAATGSWQNAEVSIHDLMLRMDELKDTTDLTTSEIAELVAQEAGLASLSDELTSSYQAQQAALNALGPAVRNVAETVLNATGSMRLAAQVAYQSTSSDSIHHGQPLGSYAVGTDFVPVTGIYQLHRGEAVLSSQENQSRQQPGSVNVQVFIGNKEFEGDMRVVADEVHTEKARRGITDRRVYR